jgi:hypothetical protein
VLVDEDRVAVRGDQHDARRACAALVGFVGELEPFGFQAALVLAHVGELPAAAALLGVGYRLSGLPNPSPIVAVPLWRMSQSAFVSQKSAQIGAVTCNEIEDEAGLSNLRIIDVA